jgi:hypothetical protein
MDEDQQERSGGNTAMGNVHFIQAAEIFFSPLGTCGYEQGKSHQYDIDGTVDLAGLLAKKFFTSVIDWRENKPHDHG